LFFHATKNKETRELVYLAYTKNLNPSLAVDLANDEDDDGIGYMNYSLPLHKLSWKARNQDIPWSEVEHFLKSLQIDVARTAIASSDGELENTPLHLAVYSNNVSIVNLMLSISPEAAHVPDVYGDLPLHWAAAHSGNDNTQIISLLTCVYPLSIDVMNKNGIIPPSSRMCSPVKRDAMYRGIVKYACADKFQDYGEKSSLKMLSQQKHYYHPLIIVLVEAVFGGRSLEELDEFMECLRLKPEVIESLSIDRFRQENLFHLIEIYSVVKAGSLSNDRNVIPPLAFLKVCYLLLGQLDAYNACDQVGLLMFEKISCTYVHEKVISLLFGLVVA